MYSSKAKPISPKAKQIRFYNIFCNTMLIRSTHNSSSKKALLISLLVIYFITSLLFPIATQAEQTLFGNDPIEFAQSDAVPDASSETSEFMGIVNDNASSDNQGDTSNPATVIPIPSDSDTPILPGSAGTPPVPPIVGTHGEAPEVTRIILTIQNGKPEQGGGAQQYNLNNGETAFVQTSASALNVNPTNKPDTPEMIAYKRELAFISTQIANKVTDLQFKKQELDNQYLIAHRAPLDTDRRQIEQDLRILEQRRTQLEAEHTAREALKPPPPPPPPAEVAQGISVTPTIENRQVTINVQTQENVQSTVTAPAGQWVQIYSDQQGGELWAKVDPAPPGN